MFTGIVAAVGRIERVESLGQGAGLRLHVDAGGLDLSDVVIGDSIAIQGACMTAVALDGQRFSVEVSLESLDKTIGLGAPGEVNLEKALRLTLESEPLRKKLREAVKSGALPKSDEATLAGAALAKGLINASERARLDAAIAARDEAIAVDDYSPNEYPTANRAPIERTSARKTALL